MEAVLAMVPAEERIKFSAMTGQSFVAYAWAEADHWPTRCWPSPEKRERERAGLRPQTAPQSEVSFRLRSTGKDTRRAGW